MAHYCKWDFVTDSFKQNPREIKESWAGFPFQGCDACMVFPAGVGPRYTKNQAYMFSGDEYCKWDLSKDAISQRPRKIADGFSSYPFAGVDAVLVFPAGVGPGFTVNMAYMFYGDSYCKWDLERDCLANGPRQIKDGFKCYPFERCDGVMVFPAGVGPEYAENQAYMFCGDEYCKWGLKTDTLSQQPRKIADGFPGFPFPRVGGVLAFPAAVAPSYARNVAYVFERGPDRAPLPRNVAACAGSPALQAPAHVSRTSMSSEEAQAVGEQLYPLVQKLNAEQAGKITGMLLELGRAQVDALLGCPASLAAWVQEAEGVLLRAERETNRRQRDTAQGLRTTQQPQEPEIAPAVVSPTSSWSSASSSPAPSSSSLTAKPSPLPPSTLMILGAEKALFRALKAKENPPTFGMIDADAGARPKGRISRVLAAKQALLGGQAEAEDREGEAGARAGGGGGASAEIAGGRGEGRTHGEEEERVEKDEAAGKESAGGKEEAGEEESGVAVCVEELESGVLALE